VIQVYNGDLSSHIHYIPTQSYDGDPSFTDHDPKCTIGDPKFQLIVSQVHNGDLSFTIGDPKLPWYPKFHDRDPKFTMVNPKFHDRDPNSRWWS